MSHDEGFPLGPAPDDDGKTPAWVLPSSIHRLADRPLREQVILAAAHLRTRWAAGDHIRVDAYFDALPALAANPVVAAELAFQEFVSASERGAAPDADAFLARFPRFADPLSKLITQWRGIEEFLPSPPSPASPPAGGDAEPVSSSDLVGYEILGELGRGGMGVVYRARHRRLNRLAALKMIHGGAHVGPTQKLRFLAEAQALARLNHPHIVKVYESGEWDGCAYIALELVEGGNLADRLRHGGLPINEAADLVEVIAWAVQAAHAVGVIHRDLKPGNILMRPDGIPVVTDFGLAKQLDTDGRLTNSGTVLGTPAYMAPEQARGSGDVGPGADVYALGIILYECVTGQTPFQGTSVELVLAQVMDKPLPPGRLRPDVPPALEAICLKCLEKDPAARYLTAGELAADLRGFQDGAAVRAASVDREKWFELWARRAGYEILGKLGEREGAAVYRARHARLRREVALKVVTAGPAARQAALELMERQVALASDITRQFQAAGNATRPPIVEVFDLGERDGVAYCATEFAPGGSLAGVFERVAPANRPIRETAELARKVAEALAVIHSLRHSHGNLSVGNVLLGADGSVTFADLRGERTASDDVYNLGVALYLLLTGRSPEPGRTLVPPGRLRVDLPAKLETICLTCLDPNPARRYRNATEVADALRSFLKEPVPVAAEPTAVDRGAPGGYTHLEPLGENRLGRVVKARAADGAVVAIQHVDPAGWLSPTARLSLRDTIRAAVKVRHPYIQETFEVLEGGSRLTLVQEYLPGGTLAQRLAGGALTASAAATIAVAVAEALHHAHRHGLFHGDLDPDKVLFDAEGLPRVTDFRLATEVEQRRSAVLTGVMDVQLETRPGYKPPEYLLREEIELTPAADVYALGALLAEMLMGTPPAEVFGGHQGQPDRGWIGLERAARKAKRVVSVPRALDAVCRKAMEWKPTKRHKTAAEFAAHVRGSAPTEKGWFTRLFGG